MTSIAAVILARGGSKGVPRKNLREVGGVHLVSRAIESCLQADLDTFVSTDDREIALVAKRKGAQVISRPKELALDSSTSEEALQHALNLIGSQYQFSFLVQPTSPFIDPKDLRRAVEVLESKRVQSVFSACEDHSFRWTVRPAEPIGHSKKFRQRRQDLPVTVRETGAFYGFEVSKFIDEKTRFCGKTEAIVVESLFAIDVDSEADLAVANALVPLWDKPSYLERNMDQVEASLWQTVRAIAYDFDGVMTDNRVLTSQEGHELVHVSRADGLGVEIIKRLGIPQAIVSSERNPVVSARADKLGIDCFANVLDKEIAIKKWSDKIGIPVSEMAFIGNDLNDLNALQLVGVPIAVSDGHSEIKEIAKIILPIRGGYGAIRYVADKLRLYTGKGVTNYG